MKTIEVGKNYQIAGWEPKDRGYVVAKLTHAEQQDFPYMGYVKFADGSGSPHAWSEQGKCSTDSCDLILPKPVKKEVWVNVYKATAFDNIEISQKRYASKKEAEKKYFKGRRWEYLNTVKLHEYYEDPK